MTSEKEKGEKSQRIEAQWTKEGIHEGNKLREDRMLALKKEVPGMTVESFRKILVDI